MNVLGRAAEGSQAVAGERRHKAVLQLSLLPPRPALDYFVETCPDKWNYLVIDLVVAHMLALSSGLESRIAFSD
jgi:hypothetical protein